MDESVEKLQDRFRSLLIYLGQLQYNIVNTRETLENLEHEHMQTIEELRHLESLIKNNMQSTDSNPVESDT